MKKILMVTLVLALILAGCSQGAVKTGLGHVISVAKSTDASADAEGLAEADTTMAAVTVDAKGVLLGVEIDVAQVKVNFNNEGVITTDLTAEPQTKVELGDAYGMKSKSSIGKEWYEQIASLEEWMKGKTIDKVNSMKIADGYADEADLTSSVTIHVTDYIAAVDQAVANAK